MEELNSFLKVAIEAAIAAGEIQKEFFEKAFEIQAKSNPADLVTEVDQKSEACILDILTRSFPDHAILSEEGGGQSEKDSPYLWAVDPLDGTTNYAHSFPIFAISIGLLKDNEPQVGVVYNPIMGELFTAVKGGGALLNGKLISVSQTAELEQALLATGFAYDRWTTLDTNYLEFCHFTHQSHGVRRLGAAAVDLAYVAAGRLDGYWERGLKPWDLAAGVLLVAEAGGRVTNYEGGAVDLFEGRILTTNGLLHKALEVELARVAKLREEGQKVPLPEG